MTSKNADFKYSYSLGFTVLLHFIVFALAQPFDSLTSLFPQVGKNNKITKDREYKITWEKIKNKPNYDIAKVSTKFNSKASAHKQGLAKNKGKKLSLSDLKMPAQKMLIPKKTVMDQPARPGQMPKAENALTRVRFGNDELKQMAKDSFSGNANVLMGDKISLKYEVPDGRSLDDLNEAELRLYGFLRRGAKNYATSIASELHDFAFKYPHVNFPRPETKQIMTGKLTYDEKGNLKQIKMIRWTNIDKLQGFFENVLKRLDVMQNPPKELWSKNGEFTVFVTLEVNG